MSAISNIFDSDETENEIIVGEIHIKAKGNVELSVAGISKLAESGCEIYKWDDNRHKKAVYRQLRLTGAAATSALMNLLKKA